jgi:hydroxymethylpyrimidine/phosphomethylpyrimidine kinase
MASGRGDAFGMGAAWHEWLPALAAHTSLVTPNWPEAQALTGCTDPQLCAEALLHLGFKAVLIKGEHRNTTTVENVLYQAQQASQVWPCERLPQQYHGSGCTLASAVAASLAQGAALEEALSLALEFTWQALKHAFPMGQGQWVPDRLHWVAQCQQG